MSSPHAATAFLHRAHFRARGLLLAWALALALLGCAVQFAPALGLVSSASAIVAPALALAASVVTIVWIRRVRALSERALARDLDRDWTLAARLEAAAELARDASALALAQRVDTGRHLAGRRPPRDGAWFSALALAALAALLLFAEVAVLGYRHLFTTPASAAAAQAATAPDISASLVWKTPASEIKATAIEEVPLAALAATRTGLRSLSLEVAVNGRHRLSVPLDAAALESLAKPGEHPIELSLYLDEVGAQEFDLVSYHLRAERATDAPAPAVASPLQFVQIRPAREDVARARTPPGPAGQILNLLTALKAAQLQLLKQNFLLAHAPLDHARPEWREENTRVASDQKTLAAKTAEARDFAIAEGLPTLVVDNLGQSQPLMKTAAEKISAAENEPAAEPQGQALALIVATEKVIRKVILESSATAGQAQPPSVRDPFKDPQQFKLPPRPSTPAGQLEQLADEQNAAAQNLSDPAASQGPDKQAELARKLAELAASRSLDSSAQTKTEQAARDAAEAAAQLRQGDRDAARAPAAAAAEALRAAAAAQKAAGRAAAEAGLEQIRRNLNAAERADDPTARSAALADAAERLRAEAAAQQQTGSSSAARELAAAAAKIAAAAKAPSPSLGAESAAPSSASPSPGQSASDAATRAQAALASREQALARALRQLGRASGHGVKGDGSAPGDESPSRSSADGSELDSQELADLELGAQLGSALSRDPAALELSRRIVHELRRHDGQAGNVVRIPDDLRDSVDRLVVLLEAARHAGLRDEQIHRYNPDDITPAYRPVVETYFEKLSREAK